MGNTEVFPYLLIHLSSDPIEFDWLRNDATYIGKLLRFLFWHAVSFDLGWDSVNTFNNINHIFECILNVIF